MNSLPNEKVLAELLEMGKDLEEQAKTLYLKAEAFAQKYEKKLQQTTNERR